MKQFALLFTLLFFIDSTTFASSFQRQSNQFMSYKAKLNELGYGLNMVYSKNGNTVEPSVHLHYSRYLTHFFSVGAGFESVFDGNRQNLLGIETSLRFLNGMVVTFKPGVVFKEINQTRDILYVTGVEAMYEINLNKNLHIGPMVEVNVIQDDIEYSAGLHLGFMF